MSQKFQFELAEDKNLSKKYNCTVLSSYLDELKNEEGQKLSHKINLKGFRKGHIPVTAIEKVYGGHLFQDVFNRAANLMLSEIVKENEFQLVTDPEIDIQNEQDSFYFGHDVKINVTFHLWPQIEELDFSKITVKSPDLFISEEDIDYALDMSLKTKAELKESQNDSKTGDVVTMDFAGFDKETNEPLDNTQASDAKIEIGSKSLIPGFEDQLIGHKTGESFDIEVTFPEDYNETLAGKTAIFKITLNKIEEQVLPELTDDLAKELGLENSEVARDKVKDNMQNYYGSSVMNMLKKKVFAELQDHLTFDIPEVLLSQRVEAEFQSELSKNDRLPEESKKSEAQIMEEAESKSKKDVALSLFLGKLARDNELEATQQDITNMIFQNARGDIEQFSKIAAYYKENPNEVNRLKDFIIEDKTYKLIFDKITLDKFIVSREEFDTAIRSGSLESLIQE